MKIISKTETGPATSRTGSRYWRGKSAYFGLLPFLSLTSIFLFYPTINVALGAFKNAKGQFSTDTLVELVSSKIARNAFSNSLEISLKTSVIGAILGGLFAWALVTGKPGGIFYRISVALSSVLAQFGGIMLTFAFLATFGFNGVISTLAIKFVPDSFLANSSWLFELNGLVVVYTFFQIPLMILIFLPSIENLRPHWREASDSLGGSALEFWLRVGMPVLTPSFIGAALLLFVNSFSAYATAATLINLSDFLTPLEIAAALTSETGGSNPTEAKALSLYMVLVVILVMSIYALLRRRVSKWEQSK